MKKASGVHGLTLLALPLWAQRFQGRNSSGGASGLGLGCFGNPGGLQVQAGQGQNFTQAKEATLRYLDLTPEQVAAWEERLANPRDQLEPIPSLLAQVQSGGAFSAGNPAAVGALVRRSSRC